MNFINFNNAGASLLEPSTKNDISNYLQLETNISGYYIEQKKKKVLAPWVRPKNLSGPNVSTYCKKHCFFFQVFLRFSKIDDFVKIYAKIPNSCSF